MLAATVRRRDGRPHPFVLRNQCIIRLLLDTGMQASELTNAKIVDYDARRGRIYVAGKGAKTRYVYVGTKAR